jgi:ADP-ribose pyrophosphatase
MSDDVEILERTTKYESHIGVDKVRLRHRQLSGDMGIPIERDLVRVPTAVGILPYDPTRDEVVLVRQFRVGVWGAGEPPWLVESVAGVIDHGEDAETTARRETMEETGCTLGELHFVCEYFSCPGIITERVKLYCGITDTASAGGNHGLAHEGEDIEAFVQPWNEAWKNVQNGQFLDAKLLLIMMWLSQKKESLLHGSQNPKEPV